ncbi:MAG TPA: TonB-dependent receptor, partial [Silvibacterium sp.]|nr:TonB-dependent receptor [Silvibacterium sp.]
GKLVPEAVKVVISSGATLHDYRGFTTTMRLRYFGPRDLTSDGINRSKATLLVNAGAGYQIAERWRVSADLLNLLDRRNDDITYAYVSRITPAAAASFTNVFHPAEPFQVRFWLERSF